MRRVRKKGAKKTTEGDGRQLPAVRDGGRALTAAEFKGLASVPAEAEWFANIDNPRTRRAYRGDIHEFMAFLGIAQPLEFRRVTRAHVLAWRKTLEGRVLSGATIRRKLAALSSLFGTSLRCECGDAQSGQGGEAPEGGEL